MLSKEKEELSLNHIKEFDFWLKSKVRIGREIENYSIVFEDSKGDWTMSESKKILKFNTYLSAFCSYEYYLSIIIHEYFHFSVQEVPEKEDAKLIKDDFGESLMKLLDIEADYYTALYFKEKLKYDYLKYTLLHYEGSQVFGDPKIRINKFERFLGSLLSIAKIFFDYPKEIDLKTKVLFLVSIKNIPTEDFIHVVVSTNQHYYIDRIQANYLDFIELKHIYTNLGRVTDLGYIERILKFLKKAFQLRVLPDHIESKYQEFIKQNTIKNKKAEG